MLTLTETFVFSVCCQTRVGWNQKSGAFLSTQPWLRHSSLLEADQCKERKKEGVSQTCTGETSKNSKRRKDLRKFRKDCRWCLVLFGAEAVWFLRKWNEWYHQTSFTQQMQNGNIHWILWGCPNEVQFISALRTCPSLRIMLQTSCAQTRALNNTCQSTRSQFSSFTGVS